MKLAKSLTAWPLAASSLAIVATGYSPAFASSSMQSEYIDKACQDTKTAICGAVVVASAGSFTLDWATVKARDTQANPAAMHPGCPSVNKKISDDVPGGNYNRYIVPASCGYKVKLKILGGNGKDQNLYLTPGCKIIVKVKGDLNSNKITVDASFIDETMSGTPKDQMGWKCGKQSKAEP